MMKQDREVHELLSAFRSLPASVGKPLGPEAQSVGKVIAEVVKKYGLEELRPEQKIVEHWKDIVGETFAGRCGPRRITQDGKLIIQVMGATVRQEMAFRKKDILAAVRKIPGCRVVKAISLVTS